jgi:Protein of unknown function (DUF3443)
MIGLGRRAWLNAFVWLSAALLAGCGGGGGGGAQSGASAVNVLPITVGAGPSSSRVVNLLFTSVTVCVPNSGTQCTTIDHVQVDTGSSGLRIMAPKLKSLALPQQTDDTGNYAIAECAQFADGFSWGPVKVADVKIAGEEAASLPIQVIGDTNFAQIPGDCSGSGPAENTVDTFGSNGVLGIGPSLQDCGSFCETTVNNGYYYPCPVTSGCSTTTTSAAQIQANQVGNPVASFTNDNNGVIIMLPAIPPSGAASVSGSLIFGIGTTTNNGIGNAKVFTLNANYGSFTTIYKNQSYNYSLFDSGSSAMFFSDSTIPVCGPTDPYAPGFFCPLTTLNLNAVIRGTNAESATVGFRIANASILTGNNPDYWAFDNLGAPNAVGNSNVFIWGLPAFFGHTVFVAIEGQTTSAGAGPFIAF